MHDTANTNHEKIVSVCIFSFNVTNCLNMILLGYFRGFQGGLTIVQSGLDLLGSLWAQLVVTEGTPAHQYSEYNQPEFIT